uniref:Uncharacterized protein n=1 Tax=Rhabditophanes sp. KR3021 TaxID=114890 RepID=A0AC35TWM1_9BILA
MNASNKEAMKIALCQSHILKACVSDFQAMASLAKTNVHFYKTMQNSNLKSFVKPIGRTQVIEDITNLIMIDDDTSLRGWIFGKKFRDFEESVSRANNLSLEWLHNLDKLSFIVVFFFEYDELLWAEAIHLLSTLLNIFFTKSNKLTKLTLSVTCRDESHNGISLFLIELCKRLKSNKLERIEFIFNEMKTATYLYKNLDVVLKVCKNSLGLKEISLEYRSDVIDDNKVARNKNNRLCLEVLKKTKNTTFLKFGTMFFDFYEQSISALGLIEYLVTVRKEKVKCIIQDFQSLNLFAQFNQYSNFEVQIRAKAICFLMNKLNLSPYNNFDSVYEYASQDSITVESDIIFKIGQYLGSLISSCHLKYLHLDNKNIRSTRAVSILKATVCSFPNSLTTLIVQNLDFDMSEACGTLAEKYPFLKEFGLTYINATSFSNHEKDVFVKFKNLAVLRISCIGIKEFDFPRSLKVLEITCRSYTTREDAESNGEIEENNLFHVYSASIEDNPMNEGLNVTEYEEHVNPLKKASFFPLPNRSCNCSKNQKQFKYCSVQYTNHSIFYCVHFNNIIDFDHFIKNNEHYVPDFLRRLRHHY